MAKLATLYRRYFLSVCMIFGCCIAPGKLHAFDYKTYSKEMRQVRSLTPSAATQGSVKATAHPGEKKRKTKIVKVIVEKLFEALDSDVVPAKMFRASNSVSFYFKPAKITKIGIKYKF